MVVVSRMSALHVNGDVHAPKQPQAAIRPPEASFTPRLSVPSSTCPHSARQRTSAGERHPGTGTQHAAGSDGMILPAVGTRTRRPDPVPSATTSHSPRRVLQRPITEQDVDCREPLVATGPPRDRMRDLAGTPRRGLTPRGRVLARSTQLPQIV